MVERLSVPRGRHAPPLQVRLESQRERLFEAAARVFARVGYGEASAELIAREAGMSKATFYEHFANKEECILALFDASATLVLATVGRAADAAGSDPAARLGAGIGAFVDALDEHHDGAQTLIVEIIGAGPRAIERRDAIIGRFADLLVRENAAAARRGLVAELASSHDAIAIMGAIAELASRQLRSGEPADVRELGPVIERLILAVMTRPSRR